MGIFVYAFPFTSISMRTTHLSSNCASKSPKQGAITFSKESKCKAVQLLGFSETHKKLPATSRVHCVAYVAVPAVLVLASLFSSSVPIFLFSAAVFLGFACVV